LIKMKVLFSFLLVLHLTCSASLDLDPEDNLSEEGFEEYFHLDEVTDPEELEKRQKALKENEEVVRENNEKFLDGEQTWYDKVNEFSDLPEDEFKKEKTGDLSMPNGHERRFLDPKEEYEKYGKTSEKFSGYRRDLLDPEEEYEKYGKPSEKFSGYGRGLLDPEEEYEKYDKPSEKYFDKFRYSRASVPASYSSVSYGYVSPVKNQKQCGACVAFSNMAAIETCFKKLTGVFGDYSEQQLIDCGYGRNGAKGCNGAYTHAYIKWIADTKIDLTHESEYPYLNNLPKLTCPARLPTYSQGAKVTGVYFTYRGDEETMKKMVYQHGAVVTTVKSKGEFEDYAGGVFAGCTSSVTDHAVTVVGYGTDKGQDYWLVKNSWGSSWGERGFIKVKRGVGMCGIGKNMVTVTCGKVSGPTDAPLTTKAPCEDTWSNCPQLAENSCYQAQVSSGCPKSCGLCPGITPDLSNTCYDLFGNCLYLAKTNCFSYGSKCKKSCGLCEGMTPHKSNTCFNKYANCADLCSAFGTNYCKLACGKC